MPRRNPGPFEPVLYLIHTPAFFRIVGICGLGLFSLLSLYVAALHGAAWVIGGLALGGALWLESSMTVCRRCRFYSTWHCLGQGMVVSRLFQRKVGGLSRGRVALHGAVLGIYLIYGLFWLWHRPMLGAIFTSWVPLLILSAIPPNGFSWRKAPLTVVQGSGL